MKHRKYSSKVIVLSLAGIMAAGLGGCRASDEMQRIVYTADASEVDETEVIMHPDIDAEEENDSSMEKSIEEEAKNNTFTQTPVEGNESNADETLKTASEDEFSDNADSGYGASDKDIGTGDSENDNNSGESGGYGELPGGNSDDNLNEENREEDSEDDDGDDNDDGETNESGDEDGGDADDSNDSAYDDDGDIVDLPDDVYTIAAPGEAGLITQMLGGEGVLLASSQSFLDNSVVQFTFADEGIGDVASLWENDGSNPMSDDAFAQLLNLAPDCCITIDGQTNFSDSQKKQLEDAGIDIMMIPELTSAANIVTAVGSVGQILGDHEVGNTTSLQLAQDYVAYEQKLVEDIVSRKGFFAYKNSSKYYGNWNFISGGDYTLILWDWDDTFSFQYFYDGTAYISQSGGAVVEYGIADSPASYYISAAGIMNTGEKEDPNTVYRAIFWPFYTINISNSIGEIGYTPGKGNVVDSTPYPSGTYNSANYGSYMLQNGEYNATYDSKYMSAGRSSRENNGQGAQNIDVVYIGEDRFPYAIAATQRIKEKVDESKNSSTGLYATRPNGIDVGVNLWDKINSITAEVINGYTTVRLDYEVVVNPSGCGSWLDGSVESVLESVWASNLYWGSQTVSDTLMKTKIKDFYRDFYRHNLSSSELEDIMDGEER